MLFDIIDDNQLRIACLAGGLQRSAHLIQLSQPTSSRLTISLDGRPHETRLLLFPSRHPYFLIPWRWVRAIRDWDERGRGRLLSTQTKDYHTTRALSLSNTVLYASDLELLSPAFYSVVTLNFSLMPGAYISVAKRISAVSLRVNRSNAFYQRVSIVSYASAGIARAEMSVCLSVCPSHSGIVSKRRKLASWFLHHPRAWTF